MSAENFTRDTLLRGRVILHQGRGGFRSSLDPVLLAGWLAPPFGRFLDIGCGTGALSFLLLARDPAALGMAVEIQAPLFRLAQSGLLENDFASRLQILHQDAKALTETACFDWVVTNPPFRPVGSGNLPPQGERAMAHHEVSLTLHAWVGVAARALRPTGRLGVIFPASRQAELLIALGRQGLLPRRVRTVIARPGEAPMRVLVEAGFTAGEFKLEPPLVVHAGAGFGPEVTQMLGETGG